MSDAQPTQKSEYTAAIDETRKTVNAFLEQYYANRHSKALQLHKHYALLWESLQKTHIAGGKRIRPYLALLTYEAFGGHNRSAVLPACVSVELLHAAMLIHDDIIDRDQYRHGVANVSGMYEPRYAKTAPDLLEARHLADSAAILGGDVLIGDAFNLVTEAAVEPTIQIKLIQLLNEAVFHVSGGELLDCEASMYPSDIAAGQVAELKTAFYSFSLPLEVGAMLAEAPQEVLPMLRAVGIHMGVAFQLADDILGMFGTTEETGKPVGNDLREGKRSVLVERGLALATPSEKRELEAALGNKKAHEATLTRVQYILTNCGALAAVETLMQEQCDTATQHIIHLPIEQTYKDTLIWLTEWATRRRT